MSAWERWCAVTELERVDATDMRLLAAAYRPLRQLGVDDRMLAIARGIYKRTWYLNQFALRRAARVVGELRSADIEVVVLKGTALMLQHYHDVGARSMSDIDLLVRHGTLDAALRTLEHDGWSVPEAQGGAGGPLRYGTHMQDDEAHELDLHEYALMQSVDDSDIWDTRVPLDLLGTVTWAPAPAEHLLLVCAHGMRWDWTTIRWVTDAMAILRSSAETLDWDRLVARATARRVTVALHGALNWLRQSVDADVPEWVLARLRAGPRLRFERTVHRVATRPPTKLGFALLSFDRYRRFAKFAPAERRPRSFPEYLRAAWDLDDASNIVLYGSRKLASRTR